MTNDAGVLDAAPDHEARRVLQEHQGDPESITDLDEVRALVARVILEHASELHGLVRDDADGAPADARQARDQAATEAWLEVEALSVVDDGIDHLIHIVRLPWTIRDHVEQRFRAALDGIRHGQAGRRLFTVRGEVAQVAAHELDALGVVVDFRVAQRGQDQEDAIGPKRPGFDDLIGIEHEILAQRWQ